MILRACAEVLDVYTCVNKNLIIEWKFNIKAQHIIEY